MEIRMDRHSQTCPACRHRFVPWNVGRVSTWSCIRCPRCNTALNRRRDAQFFSVLLLQLALLTLLFNLPIHTGARVFASLAVIVVGYIVDALTVKLVAAKQSRGIRGFVT